jgi:hypothetical protein
MKKGMSIGTFAGFASGLLATALTVISVDFLDLPYTYSTASFIPILNVTLNEIVLGMIWGVIFSIFYSILYDSIPGKDISKGLFYGMIIFLISCVRHISLAMLYGFILFGIEATFIGLFTFLIYGLVLGLLYRKPTK